MIAAFYAAVSSPATADIIDGVLTGGTGGGVFQELVPPIGNVGRNTTQNDNLRAFNELQNFLLTDELVIHHPCHHSNATLAEG